MEKETRTWVVSISKATHEAVGINHDNPDQRIPILEVTPFEVVSPEETPLLYMGTPLMVEVDGDLYFFELGEDRVLPSLTVRSTLHILPGSVTLLGTSTATTEMTAYRLNGITPYISLQQYKVYFPRVQDLTYYNSKCTI